MPEDLPDVTNVPVPLIEDFFDELIALLTHEHSQTSFADDFKSRVRNHDKFFREGLKLSTDKSCPFCEQQLGDDAVEIINRYEKFLNDEEAMVVERCEWFKKQLSALKDLLQINFTEWIKLKLAFDDIKSYLPTSSDLELSEQGDISDLDQAFVQLDEFVGRKQSDVRFHAIEEELKSLVAAVEAFKNQISACAALTKL
jgi:hypothetical protein